MKTFLKWLPVIVFLVVLSFLFFNADEKKAGVTKYVKIGGVEVQVELAVTPEAKQRGLSGRDALGLNKGMLFVFEQSGLHTFWMKDMKFTIDIIWLSEDLRIVHIKKDVRPDSYPETFRPDENAKYVLEVDAGFSDKNNLKVGDKTEFTF